MQVRSLCESQRGNLQLLPFYSRIAATLSAVFPDVGAAILKGLEDEFNHLQVSTQQCMQQARDVLPYQVVAHISICV